MKILHISPEGTEDILGGRGIFLKKIIAEQEKLHQVKLCTIDSDNAMLKPIPDGAVGWMYAVNMIMLGKLLKIMKEWTPDVIHVHDCDTADACTALKKAYPEMPMVLTIHLSATASMIEGLCQSEVQRYLMNREQNFIHVVDAIHVCSKYYADKFADKFPFATMPWYMTEKKPYVIANCVDNKFCGAGTGLDWSRKRIFFAGRFAVGKGIETICEIIDKTDWQFVFAGQFNGTNEERKVYPTTVALDAMKAKYPDRVIELGHIPHEDIGKWAKQCDVWVAPSWHCPFELVGLEAMACGVPLVCTRTGAFLEYCEQGINCTMAEVQDADSLKKAIECAFGNPQYFIRNGLETVKKYTWQNTSKQIEDMYASTIRASHTGAVVRV